MAKKVVFIVEDDQFMRSLEVQKLEAEGLSVITAASGKEALEMLAKNADVSLIVLDLILPEMSGFEVLEKIKHDPASSKVPVLVLSNLGQNEDVEKALALGAAGYMVKANSTFADITKKVQEILG